MEASDAVGAWDLEDEPSPLARGARRSRGTNSSKIRRLVEDQLVEDRRHAHTRQVEHLLADDRRGPSRLHHDAVARAEGHNWLHDGDFTRLHYDARPSAPKTPPCPWLRPTRPHSRRAHGAPALGPGPDKPSPARSLTRLHYDGVALPRARAPGTQRGPRGSASCTQPTPPCPSCSAPTNTPLFVPAVRHAGDHAGTRRSDRSDAWSVHACSVEAAHRIERTTAAPPWPPRGLEARSLDPVRVSSAPRSAAKTGRIRAKESGPQHQSCAAAHARRIDSFGALPERRAARPALMAASRPQDAIR